MSQDYLDKLIEKDKAGTQIQSIPLHDTELRGITIDDPITVEGNPINFSTKNEQNAISTIIDIEPIQDLHGYDKPWVGGAGKNLFTPITSDSYKYSHWTLSDETLFGQPVYTSQIAWNGLSSWTFFEVGTYVFSVYAKATANETATIYCKTTEAGGRTIAELTPLIKSCNVTTSWQRFDMQLTVTSAGYLVPRLESSNATSTLYVSCWQIEKSQTVTPYEPYSNICPILPHEEIKIGGCGKNLIDINNSISFEKYSGGVRDGFEFFNLKPGIYTIGSNSLSSSSMNVYFATKNAQGTWVEKNINITDKSLTFDILDGELQIWVPTSQTIKNIAPDLQLEYSNSLTDYEPYTLSNQLTLPLPEDVYGGTLNLETGELVVDRGFTVFDGSSDENWNWEGGNINRGYIQLNNATTGVAERIEYVCNEGYFSKFGTDPAVTFIYGSTGILYYYATVTSLADFKTWLASNNLQVVYELTTPYILHLTPAQLKLFKDVNNLNSSDYTTLTVTYHSNSMATLTPATDTTDGLLTAMDKRALDRTEEIIEGNPIQFETESAQVAKSTIVDLEPIQDLHGYSKPWVGGAGKNLIPMTVDGIKALNTSGTWNGLVYTYLTTTFTLLVDSDNNVLGIKINGTPTNNINFFLWNPISLTSGSSYYLSGCPDGGSTSTYMLRFYNSTSTSSKIAVGSGDVLISDWADQYNRCEIRITANIQYNNITFKPMVRLAAISDSNFEPYTNIASISGRSEVDILGCGKNLLDPAYNKVQIQGSFSDAGITYTYLGDGKIQLSNTATARSYGNFTFVTGGGTGQPCINLKNKQLILSCEGLINNVFICWGVFKSDGTYYGNQNYNLSINRQSVLFTMPNDAEALRFYIQVESGIAITTPIVISPMLRYYEIEDPTYSPYQSSTSLQIQLGQTVYGGQLDVENGVLTINRGYAEFDGSSSTNWSYNGDYGSVSRFDYSNIGGKKNGGNINSNLFEGGSGIVIDQNVENVYLHGTYGHLLLAIKPSRLATKDVTGLMTWLSNNNLSICYELATPTTISLTPEQVKLLQGINTITTNADNITLTYRNGSVATLNDLESLYAKLKTYIDSLHAT